MITLKDANSIWLESIALFQTVLGETLDEWGKDEDAQAMDMLSKVVNSDPDLLARAQADPEVNQLLGLNGGDNGNPDIQYQTK